MGANLIFGEVLTPAEWNALFDNLQSGINLKANTSDLANVAFSGAGVDLITNSVAWTPAITFATPGDLAVTYSTQLGRYWQLSSNLVLVYFNIQTSSFTFTTASGNLEITGLPFTSQNTGGLNPRGSVSFTGINKIGGYTQINGGMPPNTSTLTFAASGMGVANTLVAATDVPTGGPVTLIGETIIFL